MFDCVRKLVAGITGRRKTEPNRTPRIIGPEEHGIDPEKVSWAARRTCEILQARGFKAFVVGGAVRDLLLGVTPKDFDVTTDAEPEQVKRSQRRAYIIGKRFRLVHVVFGDEIIECSTFRALDAAGVRKDANGRVVSDNVFGEMWEDAARRDFTINAMYYDPTTQQVYDYHGGFEDLKKRRLVMIGDPVERYREDPVRMMRAVRIAAKLGFTMDRDTERAIPKMARTLENVPAARLFDEMMKLFTSGHAEACLIKLRAEGLHRSLLPMLDVILDEHEGEKFLMLALRRTDERIASGKKISPAFLFATLLWPQVKKRWDSYQERQGMVRSKALFCASEDVITTQCQKLAIQHRFVADIKLIWMLQLRFERRTGKNPYTLSQHPKYRAGYDFLLLRSLLGHVPADLVQWWDTFAQADDDTRAAMVADCERQARRTASQARAGNRRRREEADLRSEEELLAQVEREREYANGVRRRPSRTANTANTAGADVASNFADGSAASNEANGDNASAGEPAPKRRRRRSRKKTTSQTGAVDAVQTASANDSEVSAQPAAEPVSAPVVAPADGQPAEGETPAPRRRRRRRAKPKMDDVSAADNASVALSAEDKAS